MRHVRMGLLAAMLLVPSALAQAQSADSPDNPEALRGPEATRGRHRAQPVMDMADAPLPHSAPFRTRDLFDRARMGLQKVRSLNQQASSQAAAAEAAEEESPTKLRRPRTGTADEETADEDSTGPRRFRANRAAGAEEPEDESPAVRRRPPPRPTEHEPEEPSAPRRPPPKPNRE